jgi:uncharacterized Zn finger protein
MKSYELRCPICGTVNRGLYLEETDGWMECEKCGNVTQSMEHRQTVLIPLILKTQSRSDNKNLDRIAVGI